MSTYFRYFRPVNFDFTRGTLNVLPRGGICFQVNDDKPQEKYFSYSICHADDVFSKKTARHIAEDRMKHLFAAKTPQQITDLFKNGTFKPLTHHENEVIFAVEKFIAKAGEVVDTKTIVSKDCYFFADLLLLQEKINEIQATHDLAYAMLQQWRRGNNNEALRSFYETAAR